MLELSASGAKVLMLRSVEYARRYGVAGARPLVVRAGGGHLGRKEEESMEQAIVSGIAHDTSEAKVTTAASPDRPGIAARVFVRWPTRASTWT